MSAAVTSLDELRPDNNAGKRLARDQEQELNTEGVVHPGILYECQNKGLTKFAIRKLLILKDAVYLLKRANNPQKKQKRQQGCRTPNYYLLISIFGK